LKQIVFLFFIFSFFAQAQHYSYRHYTTQDGLAGNQATQAIQTRDRHIWVATLTGLSRFNGSTFKNYTVEDGLSSNKIVALFEDSKFRVWVGSTTNGVSIIDNGLITVPSFDFTPYGAVNEFVETASGIIYIFLTKRIVKYEEGVFSLVEEKFSGEHFLNTSDNARFDENTVYLSSLGKGLVKVTLNPFQIEIMNSASHGINNLCFSVYVDEEKSVWVGSYGVLYRWKENKITEYVPDWNNFTDHRIRNIIPENDNTFFLTFEGNGFSFFDLETGEFSIVNTAKGFSGDVVKSAIKDDEGNYWILTHGDGIFRYRDASFKIYNEANGLPSNFTSSVEQWYGNWVVATPKGVFQIKGNGKLEKELLYNSPAYFLEVNEEGNLLIATYENVIEITKDGTQSIILDGTFLRLYSDATNTFFFGGRKVVVKSKDSTYSFDDAPVVYDIIPLGDRYIFTNERRLMQFNGRSFDSIPGLNLDRDRAFGGIASINQNEMLAIDEEFMYHIGLREGVFDINRMALTRFKGLNNISSLKIRGNDLWLKSRNALAKVDLNLLLVNDSISLQRYTETTGIIPLEISVADMYISEEGEVLVDSGPGIIIFNEDSFLKNNEPPRITLSQVSLFSVPIQENFNETPNFLELPYDKNHLTFSMEAITFTYPETVKYKYRLDGLRNGSEWSYSTSDPKVVFSYLPPGDYIFQFTADNGNGVWQDKVYRYPFKITLPFWREVWFWFVGLSILVVGSLTIIYFKNKKKSKQQEQYTHDLIEAQENERTRLARELHDSVGQKLMLLAKKTKTMGNAEIGTLADGTLDELRSISRGLHPATMEKLGLTAAITSMINEIDANTNIFFTNEIQNIDAYLSKENSLHLYRIIQEVLNNMMKHSEAKAASVTIIKKENFIEAVVKDNGRGFVFSEKLKNSNSLGMKTLLERAKIIKSKLQVESQLNKGTKISLLIPTNYANQ